MKNYAIALAITVVGVVAGLFIYDAYKNRKTETPKVS